MTPRTAAPTTTTFKVSADLPLDPETAFAQLLDELSHALDTTGSRPLRLDPGPDGGISLSGTDGETPLAEVVTWEPPQSVVLAWRTADWGGGTRSELELRCEPTDAGTSLVLEHRGFGAPMLSSGSPADAGRELLGWMVDELLAPAVLAATPARLAGWLTDRRARRPTGPRARDAYRAPEAHQVGFDATLQALALAPDDILLEVGCGGGAFIAQALRSGCSAVAVDHSREMVRLAAETNADAVAGGRLKVLQADAVELPLPDGAFTCAAMTHVFFFLEDPVAALRECRRVLADEGRLVVYTASAELAGTPAAPEPIVRFMHFYEPDELRELAQAAGFARAEVDDLGAAQLLVGHR